MYTLLGFQAMPPLILSKLRKIRGGAPRERPQPNDFFLS